MIKIISAQWICFACPTIYTGKTAEGWTVYARYRWGNLSVRIDDSPEPECEGAAGWEILAKTIGHEVHGWLSYADLRQHTAGLVEWPDEPTEPDPGSVADPTDPADILTL
jgi:hypothetical protein